MTTTRPMSTSDTIRRQRARNAARREAIRDLAARGQWEAAYRLADTHQGQTGESVERVLGVAR